MLDELGVYVMKHHEPDRRCPRPAGGTINGWMVGGKVSLPRHFYLERMQGGRWIRDVTLYTSCVFSQTS